MDLAGVGRLRECVLPAIEPGRTVVLELSEMPFLDSAGLGTMIGLQKQATATGTTLILRDPCEREQQLFELTRTDSFLNIERTSDPRGLPFSSPVIGGTGRGFVSGAG